VEYLGIDERIILKWIIKEYVGELLLTGRNFGFCQIRGISNNVT
jgi:hypothetical protein